MTSGTLRWFQSISTLGAQHPQAWESLQACFANADGTPTAAQVWDTQPISIATALEN